MMVGVGSVCQLRMQSLLSSWMLLMRNGVVPVAWAVYSLGQRRKKAIQAMLAVAMAPVVADVVAMVSVWWRIMRGTG